MKVDIKESKFVFVNDTIESATAKNEIPEVDIVVSEWMGYFLLYENMIGSYIFAIKNFLKSDGVMIPS
jgi:protein arginine N-methyltransferase 1